MEHFVTTIEWNANNEKKPILGVPLAIKSINLGKLLDEDHADPKSRELKAEDDRIIEAVQRLIFPKFPGTVRIVLNIECQITQKKPEPETDTDSCTGDPG